MPASRGSIRGRERVFACQTLYHALLSSCIAEELGEPARNRLLFMPSIYRVESLYRTLVPAERMPFGWVGRLGGPDPATRRAQWLAERRSLALVRNLIAWNDFGEIFVFNETAPSAQYLLHLTRSRAAAAYVEDGLGAYSSWSFAHSRLREWLLKLAYGAWYERVRIPGTSHFVREVWATFPDVVRPELRGRPIRPIAADFARSLARDEAPFPIPEVMLMPAYSGSITDPVQYARLLKGVVEWLCAHGLSVGIKYHPVEENGDFLALPSGKHVSVLPQVVPSEMLLLLAGGRIRAVIGDLSTALMSAKWLNPGVVVASITGFSGARPDPRLDEVFRSLGVETANTMTELQQICERHIPECRT